MFHVNPSLMSSGPPSPLLPPLSFPFEGIKVKAPCFYKVSVSSGGKETSLSCNLGANDLITDKRVFLQLGLSNCAGCRQRAARSSLQLRLSVSQRRMALFTNAVLKLLSCRAATAVHGASCIFSPGLGCLLCSTSTLNATDSSGF